MPAGIPLHSQEMLKNKLNFLNFIGISQISANFMSVFYDCVKSLPCQVSKFTAARKNIFEKKKCHLSIAYFVTSCQPINLFYCPLGFGEMGVLFVLPGP